VIVLAAGTYEADVEAMWSTGDFNGDARASSGDLVAAFADGGYEMGTRPVVAVPEPSSVTLIVSAVFLFLVRGCTRTAPENNVKGRIQMKWIRVFVAAVSDQASAAILNADSIGSIASWTQRRLRWSATVLPVLAGLLTSAPTSKADIYRWDNGELIPGTEDITPGPGTDLNNWYGNDHNLRFADFSGGLNLADSQFKNSWLESARVANSNLEGSDFTFARLTNADLSQAHFSNANFDSATLINANLSQADLSGATFRTAMRFNPALLTNSDLSQANLTNANLRGAVLDNANLASTILFGADLRSARGFVRDPSTVTRNMIWPDGEIEELKLGAGEELSLSFDWLDLGFWSATISDEFSVEEGAILEVNLNGPSTLEMGWHVLRMNPRIPVQLGGTLRFVWSDQGDRAQLFVWPEPLSPGNVFSSVELPAGNWDLSGLYTSGEIILATPYDGNNGAGDFNVNGQMDKDDIDRLTIALRSARDISYDLNDDLSLDETDLRIWVQQLQRTWFGDANLDGQFDSTDLVQVLSVGTYEADEAAMWSTGDFNANGRFDSSDLIDALADGGYEQGPRAVANVVPEPASFVMLMASWTVIAIYRRHVGL
jgi:hypothetical protein